jgi:hypothetical protein
MLMDDIVCVKVYRSSCYVEQDEWRCVFSAKEISKLEEHVGHFRSSAHRMFSL